MKIAFVSNILNHHQYEFSEIIKKYCEYSFISTSNAESFGYQKSIEADYVIQWNKENKDLIDDIIRKADVAIFGSCPQELQELRMKENKLSFIYSERLFKRGIWRRFWPKTAKALKNKFTINKDKNLYVLCASAYLPYDLSLIKFPSQKCFKWGYFPSLKEYDNIDRLIDTKKHHSILWAGRFIKWKHPEKVIQLGRILKKEGYQFEIKMIGDGPLKPNIKKMINKYQLSDNIKIIGSLQPDAVRREMEASEIYLFTSNEKEGWGAVVNEAMNSACSVVIDHRVGSSPFLVDSGTNGLIYDGTVTDLHTCVTYLLNHPETRKKISKCAYEQISKLWNAKLGVERLLTLSSALLEHRDPPEYEDGPCSKAILYKPNQINLPMQI